MNNVLLLSAGFSYGISSSMPLLNHLSDELRNKANNIPGDNIEHWMTYLSQPHPWLSEAQNLKNKAIFLELIQDIGNVISNKIETTMSESPECPSWLKGLTQWCHNNKASIITLNYDTLVESASLLTEVGKDGQGNGKFLLLDNIYPVPMTPGYRRRAPLFIGNGEEVDSFKLFKLHGSINWYYSGASSATGETIYYSKVKSWVKSKGGSNKKDGDDIKRFLSDKVPLIVPPTTEKVAFFQHETIRTIWSLAGQAIKSANQIFCIGYSLPETDLSIRFFLHSNAPTPAVRLYVVNRDPDSVVHYRRLLGKSYEIDDRYVSEYAIERLVQDLTNSV